jgi:Mg/Co/Ni transporter MgtE
MTNGSNLKDNNNRQYLSKIVTNFMREMILACLFGVFLGLTAFLRVLFTFPQDPYAAMAVAFSTFVVVLTSVAIGSTTPFLLAWFKFNPNFGSGPVITSVVDIIAIIETCAICALLLPSTIITTTTTTTTTASSSSQQ